jgi:hypothetical protein
MFPLISRSCSRRSRLARRAHDADNLNTHRATQRGGP